MKYKKKYMVWTVLMIAFILGFKLYEVTLVNNQMDLKIAECAKELKKSKNELAEAKKKEGYYKSDEYIEKIAREEANLVKKNDIIFITK